VAAEPASRSADPAGRDSSGITTLLRAHQSTTARGGTLELTGTGPVLRSRLKHTGLDQIMTLREDPETLSTPLLATAVPADPAGIEAQTDALVRLTAYDVLPAAAADALSTAARTSLDTTPDTVRTREALAALEQMHAARREALEAARPTAAPGGTRPPGGQSAMSGRGAGGTDRARVTVVKTPGRLHGGAQRTRYGGSRRCAHVCAHLRDRVGSIRIRQDGTRVVRPVSGQTRSSER